MFHEGKNSLHKYRSSTSIEVPQVCEKSIPDFPIDIFSQSWIRAQWNACCSVLGSHTVIFREEIIVYFVSLCYLVSSRLSCPSALTGKGEEHRSLFPMWREAKKHLATHCKEQLLCCCPSCCSKSNCINKNLLFPILAATASSVSC